jgi:cellulose synthase/poly-beta-1,6-N-acetylglucosamine synthase-like glycosyltransferase
MLSDWIHWLSLKQTDELLFAVLPLLLLDAPRYCVAGVLLCVWDIGRFALRWCAGATSQPRLTHQPSVCVVLAGLNEADTVGATLASVWGSYPDLQIIVVDDGSNDGMASVAETFAAEHDNVTVLTKPLRGGKSSALNFALPFARAEIIVCVDTDSHLAPHAIWEIVQPFTDPAVGAVAGTVLARNAQTNLCTWLQAAEYLRTIFVGRMLSSRLGVLGIVSGAFGAFRRTAIERLKGWDVGPGEDGDLVLRLRKAGWRIVHAPYAQCLTNLPTSFARLFKQRRRWEWAVITFECRKHIDIGNVLSPNFCWNNLALLLERWTFTIGLTLAFVVYLVWLAFQDLELVIYVLLTNYAAYLALEIVQWLVILFYSLDRRRDAWLALCAPLMPCYFFYLRFATLVAIVEETLWRRSFDDNFVPERVRRVTWRW